MATRKLSQIAPAGSAPALTDQIVGVTTGTTDNLYTVAQLQSTTGGLIKATSDPTFYVATTGSDSNPGTIGSPFLTGRRAFNEAQKYDYQGLYSPTIQFADGTYAIESFGVIFVTDLTNCPGGPTFQGNLGAPGNCILTSGFEVYSVQTGASIGGFQFNTNTSTIGSCINPVIGEVGIFGDLIFAGNSTPFYLEGPSELVVEGVTITVTAASLQWFTFCNPGVVWFPTGTTINLPVALTITETFLSVVGGLDNTKGGVAFFRIGNITWSHFGGVTGPKIEMFQGAFLQTQNGELTDVPGQLAGSIIDRTSYIDSFSFKVGVTVGARSGYPMSSDVPQGTWGIIQDTAGVNTYAVTNTAGTLNLLSAQFPKAGANLTFYVATTGSDSNPGTIGSPFATIQHAINFASQFDYQQAFFPTIQVADGTYTLSSPHVGGSLTAQILLPELFHMGANFPQGELLGNISTPGNCILHDTLGEVSVGLFGPDCVWFMEGFQIDTPGTPQGEVFRIDGSANIQVENLILNNSTGGGSYLPFYCVFGAQLQLSGTITLTSPTMSIFCRAFNSVITIGSMTLNLAVNSNPSGAWFDIKNLSSVNFAFNTIGNKATAIGMTASLVSYSSILTQNGQESDLPGATGTIAGDASSSLGDISTLVEGFFANKKSGLPANTDITIGSWNVFKDTTGGTVNLSYNDAGTMKNVQLGGLSVTITTAALTGPGAQGSMTFTNGVLTAQTPAT